MIALVVIPDCSTSTAAITDWIRRTEEESARSRLLEAVEWNAVGARRASLWLWNVQR